VFAEFDKLINDLPEDDWDILLNQLWDALLWRGRDKDCSCRACRFVRRFAEIVKKNGRELPDFND
jgi:hypothetical protein